MTGRHLTTGIPDSLSSDLRGRKIDAGVTGP